MLSGASEDLTHVLVASDVSLGTASGWFMHAIINYTGSATEIVIPNNLNDVDIARIYQEAFIGNNITKVTIGANVTLGYNVFLGNNLFQTVYNAGSKSAGTYIYTDGTWVKQ